MEWISIKEKLPRPLENVMVYSKSQGVWLGFYEPNIYDVENNTSFYLRDDLGLYCDITHWMPLPEEPEEELSEEEKAKQALISCGILDKDGNIVDAYKDILIRKTEF